MINPYESPSLDSKREVVWYRRRRVVIGLVCLMLAGICLLGTIISLDRAFRIIADSSASVEPSDFAKAVSRSLLFTIPAAPLGVVGLVLLVLGIRAKR